ncbi:unnamed protein product [Bursaphelenchus okinawaensis]|uniref:Uncharacterized protein n=1 Tax=Bursaphelenchus okinawaensis TaxID=465554 RepID=A0A811L9J8_9BILA|nr:unnamed protein product [Bursaphelenchus okinawaensis]CAG9121581.1 unnamed protein product [Bursaphelenchus okinawaensis]
MGKSVSVKEKTSAKETTVTQEDDHVVREGDPYPFGQDVLKNPEYFDYDTDPAPKRVDDGSLTDSSMSDVGLE